jgi:hypothetical protein
MRESDVKPGDTITLNNGDKARIDSVKDGTVRATRTAPNGITYNETYHESKYTGELRHWLGHGDKDPKED